MINCWKHTAFNHKRTTPYIDNDYDHFVFTAPQAPGYRIAYAMLELIPSKYRHWVSQNKIWRACVCVDTRAPNLVDGWPNRDIFRSRSCAILIDQKPFASTDEWCALADLVYGSIHMWTKKYRKASMARKAGSLSTIHTEYTGNNVVGCM